MEAWRQCHSAEEKHVQRKKQTNPLDSDRPSNGRPLHVLILSRKRISPGLSAIRKLSRNGLMGSPEFWFQDVPKSTRSGRSPGIVIAWHSPNPMLETGLRKCPSEKSHGRTPFVAEQSFLCSVGWVGIIAKYGHWLRIPAEKGWNFCTLQTEWRRERDSNPRYPFQVQRFSRSTVGSEPLRKFFALLDSSTIYQPADSSADCAKGSYGLRNLTASLPFNSRSGFHGPRRH
jgi:hypothetical protein